MDYLTPRLIRRCTIAAPDRVWDFNFATQDYRVTTLEGLVAQDHPMARNAMFLDAMRDFMALAEGREGSGNPLLPTLEGVRESSALIAAAWEARRFSGVVEKEFA